MEKGEQEPTILVKKEEIIDILNPSQDISHLGRNSFINSHKSPLSRRGDSMYP